MFSFGDRYRNIGKYFLETEAKWFGVSQMMDLFLYDREGDERETWKDDKNFTSREFSFVDIYKLSIRAKIDKGISGMTERGTRTIATEMYPATQ